MTIELAVLCSVVGVVIATFGAIMTLGRQNRKNGFEEGKSAATLLHIKTRVDEILKESKEAAAKIEELNLRLTALEQRK